MTYIYVKRFVKGGLRMQNTSQFPSSRESATLDNFISDLRLLNFGDLWRLAEVFAIPVKYSTRKDDLINNIAYLIFDGKATLNMSSTSKNEFKFREVNVIHLNKSDEFNLVTKHWDKDRNKLTVSKESELGLFKLRKDGTIVEVTKNNSKLSKRFNTRYISPRYFDILAKTLDCDYDIDTYTYICNQFVQHRLKGDWNRLIKYLP